MLRYVAKLSKDCTNILEYIIKNDTYVGAQYYLEGAFELNFKKFSFLTVSYVLKLKDMS